MKKRLETDGESSSWNIVLRLPPLSSLSRARVSPHILPPLSLILFHSSSTISRWTHVSTFLLLIYQIITFLVISIRFLAFPIRSFVFLSFVLFSRNLNLYEENVIL